MNIGVIGSSQHDNKSYEQAVQVGRRIAQKSAKLVCGGGGGVMEAAARGAREKQGETIGILPGRDRRAANQYIDHAIATGLGQARILLIVLTSDTVVAVGGRYGTLSEIALALKHGVPVVSLNSWDLSDIGPAEAGHDDFYTASSPEEAVEKAYMLARG